ncbi:MAG: hypothetical protein IJV16_03375 [Lachnospiraceae bacterium]|nr:hypothetical protein [Lachnospiraceae bacterium]
MSREAVLDSVLYQCEMLDYGWAMKEEGIEFGERIMGELIISLLKSDRIDDVYTSISDENYRKKLYEEFNIKYKIDKEYTIG